MKALVWLSLMVNVLLIFWCADLTKSDSNFLEFQSLVLSDNLKNEVKYEGRTFVLYGLQGEGYVLSDKNFPVYTPIYIEDVILDRVSDEYRQIIFQAARMKEELRSVRTG